MNKKSKRFLKFPLTIELENFALLSMTVYGKKQFYNTWIWQADWYLEKAAVNYLSYRFLITLFMHQLCSRNERMLAYEMFCIVRVALQSTETLLLFINF